MEKNKLFKDWLDLQIKEVQEKMTQENKSYDRGDKCNICKSRLATLKQVKDKFNVVSKSLGESISKHKLVQQIKYQ